MTFRPAGKSGSSAKSTSCAWQVTCNLAEHTKKGSAKCTRTLGGFEEDSVEEEIMMWRGRHWANLAIDCASKSDHQGIPREGALPDEEEIERDMITVWALPALVAPAAAADGGEVDADAGASEPSDEEEVAPAAAADGGEVDADAGASEPSESSSSSSSSS